MSKTNNDNERTTNGTKHESRTTYADRFRSYIGQRTLQPGTPNDKDGNRDDNDGQTKQEKTLLWIKPNIDKNASQKATVRRTNRVIVHSENKKGHVTNEDIVAMKRWFLEIWKSTHVIPYDILTLESFLVTYFGYDYDEIVNLTLKKYKLLEVKYASFLVYVAEKIGSKIFCYEYLSHFMSICKRNFKKQHTYNAIIKSMVQEQVTTDVGYLISPELYITLKNEGAKNICVVTAKTKFHTITSWLLRGKFVYIPAEYHEKLQLDTNMDVLENINDVELYTTGYSQYVYTDIKTSRLGVNGSDKLAWFSALNNLLPTSQMILYAPQIKNFEHQPHLATITYICNDKSTSVEAYLLVAWSFYDQFKNDSGVVNLTITAAAAIVNERKLETGQDFSQLMQQITVAFQRLSGSVLCGTPDTVQIQIRRTVSKMGSFMTKMDAARRNFHDASKEGVYKLVAVAGKASGKTTLINLITSNFSEKLYVEDSDDYGKFISYIVVNENCGNLDDLKLSEEQVLNYAINFVKKKDVEHPDVNLTSYYNAVVEQMIRADVEKINFSNMSKIQQQLTYTKAVMDLYSKYYQSIRDLYYKLDSGKTLNQKMYENGILHFMKEEGRTMLVEFFHIFACNYRRKPPNLAIRYEPNFNTEVAIYSRIISQDMDFVQAIADVLLKMFYDQSSEYVTSIIGPSAFLTVFGLAPVLRYNNFIEFNFDGHSDVAG